MHENLKLFLNKESNEREEKSLSFFSNTLDVREIIDTAAHQLQGLAGMVVELKALFL